MDKHCASNTRSTPSFLSTPSDACPFPPLVDPPTDPRVDPALREVAFMEAQIVRLSELLEKQAADTKTYVQKKQIMHPDELEVCAKPPPPAHRTENSGVALALASEPPIQSERSSQKSNAHAASDSIGRQQKQRLKRPFWWREEGGGVGGRGG